MYKLTSIADKVYYVGVNDRQKALFENLWPLPYGVSYNSYLIVDEKTVLIDTVDVCYSDAFLRKIADALEGTCEMEIWQEAGVLEIMYGGEASMDMEEGKIHPRDQVTAVFAEEHGCNRVYLVTFSAEEYEKVLPVMRHILQECGGIFCGDTEDFKPILTE